MPLKKDGPYSWLYLAVTFVVIFIVQAFNSSNGVFVAILIEEFSVTNAKAGWVTSIVLFLYFLLCPVVIHIYQSFGFRWCMAISGSFHILAFLTTAFVPSLNYMFLTYSIPFGLTMCFTSQLAIRTQKDYFEKHYGKAMGVRFGAVGLGAILMAYFLPVLYDKHGFQGIMLVLLGFAPLYVLYALVSRTHLDDTRNSTTSAREHFLTMFKTYRELVQDKSFVLCLVGTNIFFLTYYVPNIFMVRYAVTLGYPLSKARWLLIMRSITTLPSRLIAGQFSDIAFRRGKVKFLVQFTYPIFGFLCFTCMFLKTFPLLMFYMGLTGMVEAVFWVTLSQYVDEITARYHSDEAYSLLCFISAFTILIGPPALGWLFDVTGDFRYVLLTICLVSFIAGILVICSSFVNVPQEVSLKEKGRNKKVVLDNSELSQSIEDQLALTSYETAV